MCWKPVFLKIKLEPERDYPKGLRMGLRIPGSSMVSVRLASMVLFLLIFSIVTSHAQLGPKDGENLQPTDLERVKVGDIAPDFTLENLDGKRISLSEFRTQRNVVLVFYRGQW